MARNWTPAQKSAIDIRDKTILVSAAAGSGKTSVLTARIIAKLTNESNPSDISKMLVVTFTRAAAEELRERISEALSEELKKNPWNKRISNQIVKLGKAKISTIHSFCYDIVRSNFETLGLSAGVRIADDAEIKLLRKKIMDGIIEEYYNAKPDDSENDKFSIRDFAAFSDVFVTDKDDRMSDMFITLNKKLHGYSEGIDFIGHFEAELKSAAENFFQSVYGIGLLDMIKSEIEYYESVFNFACGYFRDGDAFEKNYLPSFEYELDFTRSLLKLLDSKETGIYRKIGEWLTSHSTVSLGRGVKKDMQTETSDYLRSVKGDFSKQIKKFSEQIFSCTEEQIKEGCIGTSEICHDIYSLERRYETRLNEEKRRRGIIDYDDLERMTLSVLYKNGVNSEISDAAKEIRDCYDEIYIDEYQDVNYIQDLIFRAVAKPDNLFMVGDIKQSIYGFRGAAPDIFAKYRSTFKKYSAEIGGIDKSVKSADTVVKQDADRNCTVFLSENFRCDKPIIDFSNIIFSCLFTHNSGKVPYYKEDNLVCAKIGGSDDTVPVTVALIEKYDGDENEQKSTFRSEEDKEASDTSSQGEQTLSDGIYKGEAGYVADEIEKLVSKGYKPCDIAILLRSAKNSSDVFEQELEKRKIKYFNATAGEFFENSEIMLMMSLLCVIDNPMRDIYLAGVLMSPLYMMTLDELMSVRECKSDCSLFEALEKYTFENNFEKGLYFIRKLDEYRVFAEGQAVDKLIWYLYEDTQIMAVSENKTELSLSENGASQNTINTPDSARANLMLFYDYARKYESGSFKGLYNFIYYIDNIISERATLETVKSSGESEDSVKIMTVHQSKGLEFPVCFVCDTGRKLNKSDTKNSMILDSEYGLSMLLRDSTGFARYNTPLRQAAVMNIEQKLTDEEMRVLYVALTRARERLYVTAALTDVLKTTYECENASEFPSQFLFLRQSCYIKWILTSLFYCKRNKTGFDEAYVIKSVTQSVKNEPNADEKKSVIDTADGEIYENTDISPDDGEVKKFKELFLSRFSFKYRYDEATRLPAKLSVSKLYPDILDDESETPTDFFDYKPDESTENEAGVAIKEPNKIEVVPEPKFISAMKTVQTATSAERGTATHVCMQFCDFDYAEKNGIPAEIERQKNSGFITQSMAGLIFVKQIEGFFRSELYSRMRKAQKRGELYRELRFNVKLPACDFTLNPELKEKLTDDFILVQGVVDCLFREENGYNIVDYKTDYLERDSNGGIEEASKILISRHRRQLEYYSAACRRLIGGDAEIKNKYIYSFALSETVKVQ